MTLSSISNNIFILKEITERPEEPHRNEISLHVRQAQRIMKLEHELCTTNALSFLSSFTRDPKKVSALSIEEGLEGESLTIRIAMNDGCLETMKGGLERMVAVLMDEAKDYRPKENQEKLLRIVIDINRARLLRRLRSRHQNGSPHLNSRSKARPSIIQCLIDAVERLQGADETPKLQDIKRNTRNMTIQFARLEKLTGDRALSPAADQFIVPILHASNDLVTHCNLEEAFGRIRLDAQFPAQRRLRTLETLRKLSCYLTYVPRVLRMARKYSLFKEIIVSCVDTCPSIISQASERDVVTERKNLLLQHFSNDAIGGRRIPGMDNNRWQNILDRIENTERRITGGKRWLHAEVQLLFHYEQNPHLKKPRVICASKNACFLCNRFLGLHGQYYIPKTHGKLYPLWHLPPLDSLSVSQEQRRALERLYQDFNDQIKHTILASAHGRKIIQCYDNESMVLSIHSLTLSDVSTTDGKLRKTKDGEIKHAYGKSVQSQESDDDLSAKESLLKQDCSMPRWVNGSNLHSTVDGAVSSLDGSLQTQELKSEEETAEHIPSHLELFREDAARTLFKECETHPLATPPTSDSEPVWKPLVEGEAKAGTKFRQVGDSSPYRVVGRAVSNAGGSSQWQELNPEEQALEHVPAEREAEDSLNPHQGAGKSVSHTDGCTPTDSETASASQAINSEASSAVNSTATPLPEPEHLTQDRPVTVAITQSFPVVLFRTPWVHLSLSYECALSLASTTSLPLQDPTLPIPDRGITLRVVWTRLKIGAEGSTHGPGMIDLADEWSSMHLEGVLHSPDGLVLKSGRDIVCLKLEFGS